MKSKSKKLSEKEWKMFDKGLEEGMKVGKSFEHFKFTGKPTCISCGKEFKKLSDYTWEPDCEHGKGKWLLGVGGKG